MRARTKNQKVVVALDGKIKKIGKRIVNWAEKSVLHKIGHRYKSGVLNCLECGHRWKSTAKLAWHDEVAECKCPNCKNELKIVSTNKRTDTQEGYFTVIEKAGEYQLIRTFILRTVLKCQSSAEYYHSECFRIYIRKDGKREVMAKLRGGGFYYWAYWQGAMDLRQPSTIESKYSEEGLIYPNWDLQPFVVEKGFNAYSYEENKYTASRLMKIFLNCPHMETIENRPGYHRLYKYCFEEPEQVHKYWSTIKICFRNNYTIPVPRTYFDMIDALSFLKKDLRNSAYVCPDELREKHDYWINQKRIAQRKRDAELSAAAKLRKLIADKKAIADYEERMSRFANLELVTGSLKIIPLFKIDDVQYAGEKLHHCIFKTDTYWKNASNLLLGSYFNDELIETTQYCLKDSEVLHSYGLQNQHSKHHKKIVKAIKTNKENILKYATT
tara:strand:+ start:1606 stop:2928 length:1323 start_codon:yes stop_codon:yes gene_type:complete